MAETTDLKGWLVGLAEEMQNSSEQGVKEGGKVIADMIGDDGQGGIAKAIADYNSENTLVIGDPSLPLELKREDGTVETVVVTVKFSDNPILNSVVTGIVFGAGLTALLGAGS